MGNFNNLVEAVLGDQKTINGWDLGIKSKDDHPNPLPIHFKEKDMLPGTKAKFNAWVKPRKLQGVDVEIVRVADSRAATPNKVVIRILDTNLGYPSNPIRIPYHMISPV